MLFLVHLEIPPPPLHPHKIGVCGGILTNYKKSASNGTPIKEDQLNEKRIYLEVSTLYVTLSEIAVLIVLQLFNFERLPILTGWTYTFLHCTIAFILPRRQKRGVTYNVGYDLEF